MITKVSYSNTPVFGTTIYSKNNKFNKIADICAKQLTENDDSLIIGEYNNYKMPYNESKSRLAYKPIEYCSEDGYSDKVLVKFDMAKQSREQIADIVIRAYYIMKQREPLVKNLRDIVQTHYQELINTKKQINELQEREQFLERTLYTDKFEKSLDHAQDILNEKTNYWAEEQDIEIYTNAAKFSEEIKNSCKNNEEANYSLLGIVEPNRNFGQQTSRLKFDYTNT